MTWGRVLGCMGSERGYGYRRGAECLGCRGYKWRAEEEAGMLEAGSGQETYLGDSWPAAQHISRAASLPAPPLHTLQGHVL